MTKFDTKLHIFQNSCDSNSNCIIGNDNFVGYDQCSTVQWMAQAGIEYYIMVHGMLSANGLFELGVRAV